MANQIDPRAAFAQQAGRAADAVSFDAGLRSYMLSVYNYMASGVLLTGLVALFFAQSGLVYSLFDAQTGSPSIAGWIVMIAPFALVEPVDSVEPQASSNPRKPSMPTVRPGVLPTFRTASRTPGMNEARSKESWRIVRVSPGPPSRTS